MKRILFLSNPEYKNIQVIWFDEGFELLSRLNLKDVVKYFSLMI